ncbi:sugar-binding protein [Fimbriimonas ginsengisoli]|nr:sugar-binding protein [Fimbriimonas ginsengisoli]
MIKRNSLQFLALGTVLVFAVGCGDKGAATAEGTTTGSTTPPATTDNKTGKTLHLAFVTNNSSDFWTIARKGTEKADKELSDVEVDFKMPSDGTAATQTQILDDLVTKGEDGIAVSPVDPKNETAELDKVAGSTLVFTQDSDAPESKRTCYVGTDNVAAGRMAADEVKKALPGGGKIMVFVGKSDAQNAKERFQGLSDALKGSNIQILGLLTDDTDRVRAKANVSDTLVKTPDVAGLVGLWSYNGPAILSAVKDANKTGKVKIIAFDEEADTLAGVKDGSIDATIVQQPFEFGYQAITMMAKYLKGDKSVVPAEKKIIVPTQAIHKDSVEAFSKKLAELKGK